MVGDIAIIVTSSRLQVTLRVETCVELELSLPESDLEPSLLIFPMDHWTISKEGQVSESVLCLIRGG